jgi:hypothetical protein
MEEPELVRVEKFFFKVPIAVRDHVKKCMQHRWPMYQANRIRIDASWQ